MDAGTIFGRGMSFPPRVDDGRIVLLRDGVVIKEVLIDSILQAISYFVHVKKVGWLFLYIQLTG